MTKSVADIVALYKFNSSLFLEKIASLEAARADKPLRGDVNPIHWLAGHMASTRNYVLGIIDKPLDLGWGEVFHKPYDPDKTYPDMGEITEAWVKVSDKLHQKLVAIDEAELDREIKLGVPIAEEAVRGAIVFFLHHEAWHLGQVSYALKGFGEDSLLGV